MQEREAPLMKNPFLGHLYRIYGTKYTCFKTW